jgi:hypothetical protein
MRIRSFTKLFLVASLAMGAAMAACGDDDNFVVRTRNDGGTDGSVEGGEGGTNMLSCGLPIPTTYDSPNFALNAKEELDLKANVDLLETTMKSAEGTGTAAVTAAQLKAIFMAGTPSLYSIATAAAQAKIDVYLTQFGDAVGKTWTPADAEADGGVDGGADGGVSVGGKYENLNIFSATGVDLREGTLKIILGGALYNHALALSGGPITEATVDRLLAVFGATTKFAHRTDADAGADEKDELIAEYASRRDNLASTTLGPYRKIRGALLVAKAAAAGGDKCRADLDAALAVYRLEWEKASLATVIYYLNAAATNALAAPVKGPQALHGFGEALGFIQCFKGIPQDRRKITDVQIDALFTLVGGDTPYQLLTRTGERVVAFNTAFQQIGAFYGMTQTDIEDAKKAY